MQRCKGQNTVENKSGERSNREQCQRYEYCRYTVLGFLVSGVTKEKMFRRSEWLEKCKEEGKREGTDGRQMFSTESKDDVGVVKVWDKVNQYAAHGG